MELGGRHAATRTRPLYLGEPEEDEAWPDLARTCRRRAPRRRCPATASSANRPDDPASTRSTAGPRSRCCARTSASASPLSPNGHTGAPLLGDDARRSAVLGHGPNPFAGPPDGICPAGAPIAAASTSRRSSSRSGSRRRARRTRPARSSSSTRTRTTSSPAARRPSRWPSAPTSATASGSRSSRAERTRPVGRFSRSNLHIHHVQFDIQGSDGVSAGMVFDQSVRPTSSRTRRSRTPRPPARARSSSRAWRSSTPSAAGIAVGEGTEDIEIRQIDRDRRGPRRRSRSTEPLQQRHAGGRGRRHGVHPVPLVSRRRAGQHLLARPRRRHPRLGPRPRRPAHRRAEGLDLPRPDDRRGGRLGHDRRHPARPTRSRPARSTARFRELALWTIDDNPATDSTLNLRAEPFADRGRTPIRRCCSAPTATATRTRRCRGPTRATRS